MRALADPRHGGGSRDRGDPRGSEWYGPAVFRSENRGATWSDSSEAVGYGGDDAAKVTTVWNVTPAHGALYAGVEPAGLFRSDDGATWHHVEGLTNHLTPRVAAPRGRPVPPLDRPHSGDPDRMWVGISAVGAFETRDGGRTWETRNRGVRADFVPAGLGLGRTMASIRAA